MKTRLILGPILLFFVALALGMDYVLIDHDVYIAYWPFKPGFIALALFAGIAGSREVAKMIEKRGLVPDLLSVMVAGSILILGDLVCSIIVAAAGKGVRIWTFPIAVVFSSALILIMTSARLLWRPKVEEFLPNFGATIFTFFYVFIPIGMMSDLAHTIELSLYESGPRTQAGLWIIIWMVMTCRLGADSCAYFAGKALGKNKMIPHVSPGKTWEGFIGGVIGAVGMSLLAGWMMPDLSDALWPGSGVTVLIIYGFLVGFVSPLGDLCASALKRGAGVKDSGDLFPEFGGMIDLIDGFLLAAPMIWVLVHIGRSAWSMAELNNFLLG